jgi:hypothetical protein
LFEIGYPGSTKAAEHELIQKYQFIPLENWKSYFYQFFPETQSVNKHETIDLSLYPEQLIDALKIQKE